MNWWYSSLLRHFYERLGHTLYNHEVLAGQWDRLIAHLHLQGDEQILDVGTALGDLPLTIAALPNFHGQVMGVDWSVNMIEMATQAAWGAGVSERVQFKVVDVKDGLPFEKGQFTIVVCIGLLETFSDTAQLLAELQRVLHPQGQLVLSCYRGWSAKSSAKIRTWYCGQIAGFQKIEWLPFRKSHDLMVACQKQNAPVGERSV